MNQNVRINILILAGIGAALVALLAFITGSNAEAQLAVLAVGATLVGGLTGTMTRLSEPDPDPSVPASVVADILRAIGISPPSGLAEAGGETWGAWRPNVIAMALIGGLIVVLMTFVLDSEAALVTVAGGFVGGVVSIGAELVKPPPNPSVPASVVAKILEHGTATRS